jgi:hypothetical protein
MTELTPAQKQVIEDEKAAQARADQAKAADAAAHAKADAIQARVDAAGKPLPPPPANETPAQTQSRLQAEATMRAQAQAAGKLPATKEAAHPVGPWVPDLTDINYPPWHERNRGNEGYKPAFAGDTTSKEAREALKLMAVGELKLTAGHYDNVTGNPSFSDPKIFNPPWRWDAMGRQTQWVRP